jgi:hypothetical protein
MSTEEQFEHPDPARDKLRAAYGALIVADGGDRERANKVCARFGATGSTHPWRRVKDVAAATRELESLAAAAGNTTPDKSERRRSTATGHTTADKLSRMRGKSFERLGAAEANQPKSPPTIIDPVAIYERFNSTPVRPHDDIGDEHDED